MLAMITFRSANQNIKLVTLKQFSKIIALNLQSMLPRTEAVRLLVALPGKSWIIEIAIG